MVTGRDRLKNVERQAAMMQNITHLSVSVSRATGTTRIRRVYLMAVLLLALVLTLTTAALSGCGATIRPPTDPADPVRVYIIDYGRHSGLLLPREEERVYVEYAYGEWGWFAENRAGALHVFRTLVVPSRGTLGRREHYGPIDEPTLSRSFIFDQIHPLTVGGEEARALRRRLDERYEREEESELYNSAQAMHFVHDERRYTFWNNCNPVLAGWLKELGCEVRGPALLSRWRIED